jgi:hypothetical protein
MAATVEAQRLTEAHRIAQARLGARTVTQLVDAWALIDPADLDGTTERWLLTASRLVQAQRSLSAQLAANYLTTFRRLELGRPGTLELVIAERLDAQQALTSLTVTGPVRVKLATAGGATIEDASQRGMVESARAGMRLALDGGRATIVDSLKNDSQAHGWARATSGSPCAFCAMLAGRGPAFSEETVGFEAHDGCSCTAEPVYSEDADWPAGARQYADLYQQAKSADGDTAIAFRQIIEGR